VSNQTNANRDDIIGKGNHTTIRFKSIPLWIFIILLSAISVSGNASANPVGGFGGGFFLDVFFMLFYINLPINILLYFLFLWIFIPKDDYLPYVNRMPIYVTTGIVVAFWGTVLGALIDMVSMLVLLYFIGFLGLLAGLMLIPLTFYVLASGLHKLPDATSFYIAICFMVVNLVSWIYFMLMSAMLLVALVIFIIAIPVAVAVVIEFSKWYVKKQERDSVELAQKAKESGPSAYPKIIPEKHIIDRNDIIVAGFAAIFMIFMLFIFPLLLF
jgi:hypothetical protein